jgi:hypothetical protein
MNENVRNYLSPRRKARKGTVSDPLGDLGGFARRKYDPATDAAYGQCLPDNAAEESSTV